MDIVRTQIYLRKNQHQALRQEAHRLGVSLTELLRRALDDFLRQARETYARSPKGLSAITALGQSGLADGSVRHDVYVADSVDEHLRKNRKPSAGS